MSENVKMLKLSEMCVCMLVYVCVYGSVSVRACHYVCVCVTVIVCLPVAVCGCLRAYVLGSICVYLQ